MKYEYFYDDATVEAIWEATEELGCLEEVPLPLVCKPYVSADEMRSGIVAGKCYGGHTLSKCRQDYGSGTNQLMDSIISTIKAERGQTSIPSV